MTILFDREFYALQLLSQNFSPKNEIREENCEKPNFGAYTPVKTTEGVFRVPPTFISLYTDPKWSQKKLLSSQKVQSAILCSTFHKSPDYYSLSNEKDF